MISTKCNTDPRDSDIVILALWKVNKMHENFHHMIICTPQGT